MYEACQLWLMCSAKELSTMSLKGMGEMGSAGVASHVLTFTLDTGEQSASCSGCFTPATTEW